MNIVIFTHPSFLASQSMPRYAQFLHSGLSERGHQVECVTPKAYFYHLPAPIGIKKYLGYIDQYLVFPIHFLVKLPSYSNDTLFVFADQALGPWVPLVKNRKHVVHCHDFIALKSALGQHPEIQTSVTGKIYQNFIRNGFSKGENFISISQKTQEHLHELHRGKIEKSSLCYNGLNRDFRPLDPVACRSLLEEKLNINLVGGYILHIGGNQYYKNRCGVLEIYETWRNSTTNKLPLLMVGSPPTTELMLMHEKSLFKNDIHFITNLADNYINPAYAGANCLVFPSLYEGFGWPIAEAMASGCLVITTAEAPMTEVGGEAAFYIPKRPNSDNNEMQIWKKSSSIVLNNVLSLSGSKRELAVRNSTKQAEKFNTIRALNAIEKCYEEISVKK